MKAIEAENEELSNILPQTYNRFENSLLVELLKSFNKIDRGEEVETVFDSALLKENFPEGQYIDVAGLCNVATVDEIKEQGWSLNPGRYVGVAEKEEEDFDFAERLEELNEELEILNSEARELEERIAENVNKLLEARD